MKKDLITYYREKESTISVAPLVEQHEGELTKFYVRLPMMAYNKPNAFGQKKQSDENSEETISEKKKKIRTYKELLLNGNEPYRRIYIMADAGMGKTSFAKMLAVTWCKAHASKDQLVTIKSMSCADEKQVKQKVESGWQTFLTASKMSLYTENRSPDKSDAELFYTEDISTMEKFDFLFLVKLREYEDSNKCSLHEMIFEKLIPKLQHECWYKREFLEKVLCNKQCLIIVDGLDEWSHPKSCGRGEIIPHRKQWPGCTVLTSTRPWKFSCAQLSKFDIDRQVEISQLDETTARTLESRAVAFLNENQRQNVQVEANSNTKTVTDFENSVPKRMLGHIVYIPFVLLQMICLWFGNNPIGKSLCEVYSNIIELTFNRWLVKTDSGHTDCKCDTANIDIKCMKDKTHCQYYMPLLLKIGKLAFSTLFNVEREESLLFDKKRVLKYLSEEDLKQCLDTGLLSQVKDTSSLTKVRLQLYFPHKTLHEFFCALFIATGWKKLDTGTMSIKQTISNICASVTDILEMSQVFVFVCGLNPEVYSGISRHLATIVDMDQSIIDYRNNCAEENPNLLQNYQDMQISCFLECTRNQHLECKIVLEDLLVSRCIYGEMEEDEKQALEKILRDSACSMKSLTLYDIEDSSSEGRIVRILEQTECPCLESLRVELCKLTVFPSVLTTVAQTLKYLKLASVFLTDDSCNAMSRLDNLRGLYLRHVDVSSNSLNTITACIKNFLSLQKLRFSLRHRHIDTDEKPGQWKASNDDLLRSIEAKTTLTCLTLLFEHGLQHCVLDLSKHDKLQELLLRFPLSELHINTEQLVKCNISRMHEFSAPAVSSLLAELHDAPRLEKLTLHGIENPPPRMDITALPVLREFTLVGCFLRNSTVTLTLPLLTEFTLHFFSLKDNTFTVTLSPEMTSLETIKLWMTTANIPCCRELFLSISKLPQPITVKLEEIYMTVGEWRELFLSIGKLTHPTVKLKKINMAVEKWRQLVFDILCKLPKAVHVEMVTCKGPTEKEWKNIVDDMKASPAFHVTAYSVTILWYNEASISFDTVVV